jgi:tetratricopeptide (TPR) repeat protein
MAERTIELDPLNPVSFEVQMVILYYNRRYQDALSVGRRGIQMAPDRIRIRAFLGHSLLQLGEIERAAGEYARMPGDDYRRLLGQAVIAARLGRRTEAEGALDAMRQRYHDAVHYQYGQIYAQLGMADRAFAAFDAAWNARDSGLGYLRIDPFLDPLRDDPRLKRIEDRLNFPAANGRA